MQKELQALHKPGTSCATRFLLGALGVDFTKIRREEVTIKCRIRGENDGVKGGLGKKVHMYWMEKNIFEITEKNLMKQIRAIMTKGWLTKVEIRRNVEKEEQDEGDRRWGRR